jgi:hypothetical protein
MQVSISFNELYLHVVPDHIQQKLGLFLLATASRPALGPTRHSINGYRGFLPQVRAVKEPDCEADHSPPSNAEVKNAWNFTATPPIRLHIVVFNEATDTSP